MNSIRPIHVDNPVRALDHTTANPNNAPRASFERGLYRTTMHLLVACSVLWSLAVFAMVLWRS